MIGPSSSSIELADRFIKAGDPAGRVWVVIRLWTTSDGLPHARLEIEGRRGETRIMSVSALSDRHFYSPASPRR
jgi:hypothetical protein